MRVGLDFDGVFVNISRLKRLALLDLYNLEVPISKLHKYTLLNSRLVTSRQYDKLNTHIYNNVSADQLTAVPGVCKFAHRLINEGYELEVVTLRRGKGLDIAREWLTRKKFNVPIHGVRQGGNKRKFVEEIGFDVFVDDDLYKLEPLCDLVPHRFLFSWPYNRHIDESSFVKRVHSWRDLHKEIITLNNLYLSHRLKKKRRRSRKS